VQEKSLTFWLTVCCGSQLSQFDSNSVVAGVWPWSSVTVWVWVVRCLKHNTNDSPWGRMYALYYVCTYTWTVATTVYHKQESITVWRCGRFWRWTRLYIPRISTMAQHGEREAFAVHRTTRLDLRCHCPVFGQGGRVDLFYLCPAVVVGKFVLLLSRAT